MVVLCRIRTKNVVCLAKKKTAHSFPCKQDHTHTSTPTLSQITEPAVFTLIFYLYVCTDVRYWSGGGVPINLWSPTSRNLRWLVCVTAMHARTTATWAGNHQGLPISVRQRDNLENAGGKLRTFFQN